ncbi:MAG: type II secretion system protein GspK [Myxococcales bacterium]|jgi:general secretion pathway protein K|nr:type II secretion system protein GspK [Myxococcales bacterium]
MRSAGGERGIALLMVIWIFMVLSVLSAEFARAMRDDAIATQNLAEEVQARGVAIAGINRAIYRLLYARQAGAEDDDPDAVGADAPAPWLPDGRWHEEPYWGGTYGVRLIDEGGKISLNRADETLLRKVFETLGMKPDEQEEIVDAIIDWRDSDDLHRLHGAEDEYYMKLPEPYHAKNGPFDSVDELLQVRGITRELFFGERSRGLGSDTLPSIPLREVFSVFNRSANINVRTAPVAVLRVVLGGDEQAVDEIVTARDEDPSSVLGLIRAKVADQVLARRLVDRAPSRVAIEARAMMQNGRVQARVGAVVEIPEDGDGFHIDRWYDRLPAF